MKLCSENLKFRIKPLARFTEKRLQARQDNSYLSLPPASPVTSRDHEGRTCLHLAASNDSVAAVTTLLDLKVTFASFPLAWAM